MNKGFRRISCSDWPKKIGFTAKEKRGSYGKPKKTKL
jgi:hypothetical protein